MNGIKFSYTCPRCSGPAKKLDGEDVCLRCGIRLADVMRETGKITGTVTVPAPPPTIVVKRELLDSEVRKVVERKMLEALERNIFELPVSWDIEQLEPGSACGPAKGS